MEYERYSKRVYALMAFYKLSVVEMENKLELRPMQLMHILSGRSHPNTSIFVGFAKSFPELNMRWFISGEGEMIKATDNY